MAISSTLNSTANSYVKSTATSSATSTASTAASSASTAASDVSGSSSTFGEMLTQANLSSVPSKALSPEVMSATVESTTMQTSGYVFDPLCVVGIVPESNTFLQAIRQMMGKPFEAPAPAPAPEPVAAAAASALPTTTTPTTASALTPFGQLPAATTAMPAAPAMPSTPASLPLSQQNTPESTGSGTSSSVANFMSSLEAQLSYQDNVSVAQAAPAQVTTVASIVEAATIAAQSNMTGDLVDQYLADTSAATSAKAESDLASVIDKEAQAA